MRVQLHADNRRVRILGADTKLLSRLDRICSYLVQGFRYVPAFRKGWWDGRERLLVYRRKPSGYFFPFGLLEDVVRYLNKRGVDYDLDFSKRHISAIT